MSERIDIFKITDRHYRFAASSGLGYACMDLLIGNDQALLMDTGYGLASIMPVIRTLTDLPVTVALTHAHADHAGGVFEFDQVMIGRAEEAWIRDEPKPAFYKKLSAYMDAHPPILIDDGDRIDLGGITLRCLLTPGHTPGGISFFHEESGQLYVSDAICRIVKLWQPLDISTRQYHDTVLKAAALQPEVIWTGHDLNPLFFADLEQIVTAAECALDRQNDLPVSGTADTFLNTTPMWRTHMSSISVNRLYQCFFPQKGFAGTLLSDFSYGER